MSSPGNKLFFMVGRMNPPTPGHLQMINLLANASHHNDATPYVYLSSSYNYKPKKKKGVYQETNIKPFFELPLKNGKIDVKNKMYESPLFPEQKQYFLQKMLETASSIPEYENLRNVNVVVDNKTNGTIPTIGYVNELKKMGEISDIGYFFGLEEDAKEREGRESTCINVYDLSPEGEIISERKPTKFNSKFNVDNCYTIPRFESEYKPLFKDQKLSGSKARQIAFGDISVYSPGNTNVVPLSGMRELYTINGIQLLNDSDLELLIILLNAGVNNNDLTIKYNYPLLGLTRETNPSSYMPLLSISDSYTVGPVVESTTLEPKKTAFAKMDIDEDEPAVALEPETTTTTISTEENKYVQLISNGFTQELIEKALNSGYSLNELNSFTSRDIRGLKRELSGGKKTRKNKHKKRTNKNKGHKKHKQSKKNKKSKTKKIRKINNE